MKCPKKYWVKSIVAFVILTFLIFTTSSIIVEILKVTFTRLGIPKTIRIDNDPVKNFVISANSKYKSRTYATVVALDKWRNRKSQQS